MTRGVPGTRTLVRGVALTVIAISVAGCTSSGVGGNANTGSPAFTESIPTDSATMTDTSAPTTQTSTPTTPASSPSSTPSGASPNDCRLDELTVRVLRGSGDHGQEFALITFTNDGTRTCTMFGFPGVSLRRANALLGKPAQRSAKVPHTVSLKPGVQAEASVTVFSTCNANLSDAMRVYPPNSTQFVDRPAQLRGCTVVVDPVVLSQ